MIDEELGLEHVEIEVIIDFCLWHRQWLKDGEEDIFTDFTDDVFEYFMVDES